MAIPVIPSPRLDRWLPDAPFRDVIVVRCAAPPDVVMRAAHEVTLRDMPLAALLGRLRYLPSSRAARERGRAHDPDRSFLDQVARGPGSIVLHETANELVTGSVGRLHRIRDQEPVPLVSAEHFAAFRRPGYEKLAMSLRVARDGDRTLLSLEHRTQPTDADAHRRFARYWRVIRPGGAFVTRQLLEAIARRAERIATPRSVSATVP